MRNEIDQDGILAGEFIGDAITPTRSAICRANGPKDDSPGRSPGLDDGKRTALKGRNIPTRRLSRSRAICVGPTGLVFLPNESQGCALGYRLSGLRPFIPPGL